MTHDAETTSKLLASFRQHNVVPLQRFSIVILQMALSTRIPSRTNWTWRSVSTLAAICSSPFLWLPVLASTTYAFVPTTIPCRHKAQHNEMPVAMTKNGDSVGKKFPKLIVLDLDNTVWTPELYQLRRLQRANQTPVAGRDVKLFPGFQDLFAKIEAGNYFPPSTKFAVASRTQSVDWAHDLLTQFNLRDVLDFIEIFPGNKKQHFDNLSRDSGIAFEDMLFFDDARDGKYGNCEPVSQMGVLSVHCPGGLETSSIWETGLRRFEEWDKTAGTIVEWDGSVTNPTSVSMQQQEGTVKNVNVEKRYGFIQVGQRRSDVFFHFSSLPDGVVSLDAGEKVKFTVEKDPRNGKFRAANIELLDGEDKGETDTVSFRAFSMNMPFAALLANGYKTLESRNGTMFKPYPAGTQMLLHVGRRNYPDGNRHLEIMRDAGLNEQQIKELKSLPQSFGKGMAVAILEIGQTIETTLQQRSEPTMQRQICAYGSDSGRIVTEIARVAYLKHPVPMSAQGGVWKTKIPQSAIPDDWELADEESVMPQAYRVKNTKDSGAGKKGGQGGAGKSKRVIYSISG